MTGVTLEDVLRHIVRDEIRAALAGIQTDDQQLLVSTAEAGHRLDVSDERIRELLAAGELTAVHGVGRGAKVTVQSLREYVVRQAA